MFEICLYLGICAAGYAAAIPLRRVQERLSWFGKVQTVAVLFLVFTMGARIGANEEIVHNLGTYGLYALFLTIAALGGSVAAVSIVRKILGINRYGLMKGQVSEKGSGKETAEQADSAASGSTDHMTIYILLLVILGILAGLFIFRNVFTDYEQFERIASLAIRTELCILLAFVGLELGIQGDLLDNFRAVGLRVLAIPFAVIAGTLAASALVGIFLPIGVKNSLAVSTGLGWYSLAAGMLMDAGLMEAGAISFMHNVMRELLAIVLLPLVAKKIGYVEAVSLPGASAMDVCLPIVVRATSANTAVYSFISGLITGLAVPVLVPLFC